MGWPHGVIFSNRSAGVAICFYRCPGKIIKSKADNDGHWVACVLEIESLFIILVNVYGYNDHKNRNLLHQVTTVSELNEISLLIICWLEVISIWLQMNWMDRWPTRISQEHNNQIIINFMNENNLMDIWRTLNKDRRQFTWLSPMGKLNWGLITG